jgi:hypothetical protein
MSTPDSPVSPLPPYVYDDDDFDEEPLPEPWRDPTDPDNWYDYPSESTIMSYNMESLGHDFNPPTTQGNVAPTVSILQMFYRP